MLKKYVYQSILKKCIVERVWTGRAGSKKFAPQAGRAEILRLGDMGRT
jgi:hypothetical protein